MAEDTVIHAYGFYSYSPGWSVTVDQVPLMVLLIWPVVILSARDLALSLGGRASAILVGLVVLADASLIEPIAVRAGLWSWSEPGLFGVPPVGLLGWAYFAALAARVGPGSPVRLLLAPAAATHLLLLATWWGALRWVSGPIPPWPAVGLAWAGSLALTAAILRRGLHERVPTRDLLMRLPAALFFFGLLAVHREGAEPLVAYALAFGPPYLALMRRSSAAVSSKRSGPAKSSTTAT